MNKLIKRLLLLILVLVIALLIYKLIEIYAIFQSETNADLELKKAAWHIVINGTDIANGTNTEFVIDEVKTEETTHVRPGNFSPGLSGSFDIVISFEETDVSVKYDVTIDDSFGNDNFKIVSIEEIENQQSLTRTGENTYTGLTTLEEIKNGTINHIQVKIEWIEDGLHDKEDTELGRTHETLGIPIIIHASQYLGEDIIPYAENTDNNESK